MLTKKYLLMTGALSVIIICCSRASWELLDIVEAGDGPHGVSYTPGGEYAFITLSNKIPGKVVVITETDSGEFKVTQKKVGTFSNEISTRFGKNQNS
ncbi:MAG: hypothetical protein CV087_12310 [Candidatus Brocadia sp. WS118]|nr:MAG: hypothetical protein CV087_12310 [Candidatus Brocadia sp. WS118]